MALTHRAHQLIREHFSERERRLAIDATCGNGHDTEFLLRLGFEQVLGFDVQQHALEATRLRLQQASLTRFKLIHDGHENMAHYVSGEVDCLMFNFGYLPGGDKNLTTQHKTSLKALQLAADLSSTTGLISLMCYPGHPAGAIETEAIKSWLGTLGQQWLVETHESNSPKPAAPVLFLLTRNV